jgi:hypothetical protein
MRAGFLFLLSTRRRLDRIQRSARSNEQRAMIAAAKAQAAWPLRHFERPGLVAVAVIDVNLIPGNVNVARSVGDNRSPSAFRKQSRA